MEIKNSVHFKSFCRNLFLLEIADVIKSEGSTGRKFFPKKWSKILASSAPTTGGFIENQFEQRSGACDRSS